MRHLEPRNLTPLLERLYVDFMTECERSPSEGKSIARSEICVVEVTDPASSRNDDTHQIEAKLTQNRLISAVLDCWRDSPGEMLSVRNIVSRAQASPSSIAYHFENVERLYDCAQRVATMAARDWLTTQIKGMQRLPRRDLAPAVRTALFVQVLDDWCETQRVLAMARLEAAAKARRGVGGGAHGEWCELFESFWKEWAECAGMTESTELLVAFFFGESTQHLLRTERAVDYALLHENVFSLMRHLEGKDPADPMIRSMLETQTRNHGQTESHELDIVAARLLGEAGIVGLTFRAVAKEASVPLGQVAYQFGSKSELLRRAFEEIYRVEAGEAHAEPFPETREELRQVVCEGIARADQPVLRAFDEVTSHIARNPEYADMRRMVRVFPDPAAMHVVEGLLGEDRPVSSSLSAAFSSICRGLNQLALQREQEAALATSESVLQRFQRN